MNTREKVALLLAGNPQLTYRELGEVCGVKRQRIHQIVKHDGLHKIRRETKRPCLGSCGRELYYGSNKNGWCKECMHKRTFHTFTCASCGTKKTVSGHEGSTRRSQQRSRPSFQYCNMSCRTSHVITEYWRQRKAQDN